MAGNISASVEQLIKPIAESFGLEIVEVDYSKKTNGMNLTIFIDKPNGVSIDDCERLHHAIDEPLDNLDPTSGAPYTLNVSSPGLDRPLKSKRDYEKNLNKEIIVKLYAAEGGKKRFEGFLHSFDDDSLTIQTVNGMKKFEKIKTAKIEPLIRF